MMRSIHLRYAIYGLVFGFFLSRIGFADFGEVHRMFLLTDLRLVLAFAGGVCLAMFGFYLLTVRSRMPGRPMHPGRIIGGVLFGVGWATTGACPSIILVQLGEGKLAALVTTVGLLAGTLIYPKVHRRYFRWDPGSCSV